MNTPENVDKIAETLRSNGYDVEPQADYLEGLAQRLRNAGFKVTRKAEGADHRPAKDAQAEAEAPADDQQGSGAQTGAQSRAAKKTPAGQSPPQGQQGATGSAAPATN